MSENEKLIEEARRFVQDNNMIQPNSLMWRLLHALEVAEKAHTPTESSTEHQKHAEARRDETMTLISHTPTDDEREALLSAIINAPEPICRWGWPRR